MIVLVWAVILIAAGMLYEALGAYLDARRFPPPGRLLASGAALLYLNEQGSGEPIVVLESGIAASSVSWGLVQPRIAEFAHVCSYDRGGLGWSERCSTARTVEQMVSELSEILSRAHLPPPYVLVGHSFGGLLVRAYAYLKPDQVSGLVLVDPVSCEYWANCDSPERKRLQRGVHLSRRGAWLARFGIVRAALAALVSGGRRFPKLMARAAGGQGSQLMERLVGEVQKLPPELWPMIRAHWSRPRSFQAMATYLECLPISAEVVAKMSVPPNIPVTVVSASISTAGELAERDEWVRQSERGRHIHVENCGHWIQLERPDVVIAAVRELVEYVDQAS